MNIRQSSDCCKLLVAVVGIALCSNGLAWGQNEGLNITNVEGALEAVAGYQLKVKPEQGDAVVAVVNPQKTDFEYTGTAEPEFLRPGLMVRFTAAFDASGKPQESLKELEIFNPARKRRMTAEYMRDQTAGIYPADAKAGNTENAPVKQPNNNRNNRQNNGATPAGSSMQFRIVGKLTSIQGNTIQVAAGARPIMIQFDKELKISVVAGDTTFCQPGDKVQVTGLSNAAQKDFVDAEKITVTAAKPLAPPKPGENTRAARTRRGKADEDGNSDKAKAGNRKDRPALGSR